MANTVRLIFAGFSLFLIGDFLYGSPELVETGFLSFQPMKSVRNGSSLLLTAIWAFVILETIFIASLFAKHGKVSASTVPQFGIASMLIWVAILTTPLAIGPVYESVVSTLPSHSHGNRGLPIWLVTTLVYTMLLPIAYLCRTGKRIFE